MHSTFEEIQLVNKTIIHIINNTYNGSVYQKTNCKVYNIIFCYIDLYINILDSSLVSCLLKISRKQRQR